MWREVRGGRAVWRTRLIVRLVSGEGVEDAGGEGGAGEDCIYAGEGFRNSALYGGGEGKGEAEGLGANREQEGASGSAVINALAHEKEKRGIAGMGEQGVTFAGEGGQRFAMYETRGEARGGVQKDSEFATAGWFSKIRGPLLGCLHEKLGSGEVFTEGAGEMKSNGIVAAERIATSEDKGAIHQARSGLLWSW